MTVYDKNNQVKKIEVSPGGDFTCLCRNVAESDGFDTCTRTGLSCEPDLHWHNLYRCNRCFRLIRGPEPQNEDTAGEIDTEFYYDMYKRDPDALVKQLKIHEEWPGNVAKAPETSNKMTMDPNITTVELPTSLIDKLHSEHTFCCLEYSPTTSKFVENVLKCLSEISEREKI